MHIKSTNTAKIAILAVLLTVDLGCDACFSSGFSSLRRMFRSGPEVNRRGQSLNDFRRPPPIRTKPKNEITRLNAPGQRFTATHGVMARKGEHKMFVFVVDRDDVNYMAVSSNVAIEGTRGGPERYDLYMKFGSPPTPRDYDQASTVTASESYVGDVLYSRDITLPKPTPGNYYFLMVAHQDFRELLITAIMDTPPDDGKASFSIRRMGKF